MADAPSCHDTEAALRKLLVRLLTEKDLFKLMSKFHCATTAGVNDRIEWELALRGVGVPIEVAELVRTLSRE